MRRARSRRRICCFPAMTATPCLGNTPGGQSRNARGRLASVAARWRMTLWRRFYLWWCTTSRPKRAQARRAVMRRLRMAMKTAIYCRVSTDKQDTDNQLLKLRDFAAKQGWDNAVTGKTAERVE